MEGAGGVDELLTAYTKYGPDNADLTSSRFVRRPGIGKPLAAGLLDDMLRRRTSEEFPVAAPLAHGASGPLLPLPRPPLSLPSPPSKRPAAAGPEAGIPTISLPQ